MSSTVVGLYDRLDTGLEVIRELAKKGIAAGDLSLIARSTEERYSSEVDPVIHLSNVAVQDLGPMVGGGPLMNALGEAEVGETAKWLARSLVEAGVPEQDANIYVDEVRRGGVLVVAYTEHEAADGASEVMNRYHPINIEGRGRWAGFNENPEAFAFREEKPPYHEREAASQLDYGPGARSYLAGQPISAYDRRKADLGNYQNSVPGDWSTYEPRLRKVFDDRETSEPGRWEDFRDVYRYGFERCSDRRFAGKRWEAVRGELRSDWERQNPDRRWEDYEDAVYQGWRAGRGEDEDRN